MQKQTKQDTRQKSEKKSSPQRLVPFTLTPSNKVKDYTSLNKINHIWSTVIIIRKILTHQWKWSSARNTFLGKALCPLIRDWTIWGKLLCVLRNCYRAVQIHLPLQKQNCVVTHIGTEQDQAVASNANQEDYRWTGGERVGVCTHAQHLLCIPPERQDFSPLAGCAESHARLPNLCLHCGDAAP